MKISRFYMDGDVFIGTRKDAATWVWMKLDTEDRKTLDPIRRSWPEAMLMAPLLKGRLRIRQYQQDNRRR